MTRSHRNEDRGGERRWTFNGVEYPTRKLMCAARREEYVRLLDEEGMNFTQAAHAAGVSKRTGKVWRNGRTRATGRNEKASIDWYRSTMDKPKRIHARYLNQEERILIADRLRLSDSIRAIARLLGRDPGTVSREVERNRNPESGDCEPYRAQQKAADRLKRPKPRKAADGTPLWAEILAGLRRHWNPEQISGRLKAMFPDNGDMHASVETIYQAIYPQARGELKQELKRAMRQGRTVRRPQGGQGRKPRFREPMVMISERPPEIEDRAVPGHWEDDLITGSRNKSAIGTPVERATKFTIPLRLPDGHDAEHVQQAIIDKMASLPKLLRNSLTWDQGGGTRPAQTDRRLAGHGRLLLRPALPVAARHQREHQRAPAPVLPQRHRPIRLPGGLPRRGRRGTQRPATQDPRLHETKREDHRTARRRVIASTTDNVAMEGRSNLRCCNHH